MATCWVATAASANRLTGFTFKRESFLKRKWSQYLEQDQHRSSYLYLTCDFRWLAAGGVWHAGTTSFIPPSPRDRARFEKLVAGRSSVSKKPGDKRRENKGRAGCKRRNEIQKKGGFHWLATRKRNMRISIYTLLVCKIELRYRYGW